MNECQYLQSVDAGLSFFEAGKGKCGPAGTQSRIQVCPYGCLSAQGLNHLKENLKLNAYVGASFLFVLFCFIDAVCFRGLNIQAVKKWALFVFSTKVLCS